MKVAWKMINGHGPYAYLQESVREGDKVISRHVAYLGKAGSSGGVVPGSTIRRGGQDVTVPALPEKALSASPSDLGATGGGGHLVLYHGTGTAFQGTPSPQTDVYGNRGVFLTDSYEDGRYFAEANTEGRDDGNHRVFAARVDMSNVEDLSGLPDEGYDHNEILERSAQSSADVVILPDMSGVSEREILVKDPRAIKDWAVSQLDDGVDPATLLEPQNAERQETAPADLGATPAQRPLPDGPAPRKAGGTQAVEVRVTHLSMDDRGATATAEISHVGYLSIQVEGDNILVELERPEGSLARVSRTDGVALNTGRGPIWLNREDGSKFTNRWDASRAPSEVGAVDGHGG